MLSKSGPTSHINLRSWVQLVQLVPPSGRLRLFTEVDPFLNWFMCMCHLTFHTENGKRVAEVTSLLAETGNKTVSQPGREVKRLKGKHDLADEDVLEAPRRSEKKGAVIGGSPRGLRLSRCGWMDDRFLSRARRRLATA